MRIAAPLAGGWMKGMWGGHGELFQSGLDPQLGLNRWSRRMFLVSRRIFILG
jgi:hypothetical protein